MNLHTKMDLTEKDVENTGFDVDDEETGYGWYLARTEGGKWRIISSGY